MMEAHIGDAALFDMDQARGDAIHERLNTDEAQPGMGGCLCDEMFAAPEANFEHISLRPSTRGWEGRTVR